MHESRRNDKKGAREMRKKKSTIATKIKRDNSAACVLHAWLGGWRGK
jgi:hypothetical protein